MSTNKTIVVFPRGSLSRKDCERLTKSGYCAVEAEDPAKVCLIVPGNPVRADDFTMATIAAMSIGGTTNERAKFAEVLFQRIKEREMKANQESTP